MSLKCLICGGSASLYFQKSFPEYGLQRADYVKCNSCGFVWSKTHFELSDEQWETLNQKYHSGHQGALECSDDPSWASRLASQAKVIADLAVLGLIDSRRKWVDFGCGDGKLSNKLAETYGLSLAKYERYMPQREGYLPSSSLVPGSFGFVISTSVFEHLRSREQLDEIASLVASDGAMGVHTLIANEVPRDSSWFYLLPVHCAFFTNASMQYLMERWGFVASIYNVESRLWIFFKQRADHVERAVATANSRSSAGELFYHFKHGFVDYWKLDAASVMKRLQGAA